MFTAVRLMIVRRSFPPRGFRPQVEEKALRFPSRATASLLTYSSAPQRLPGAMSRLKFLTSTAKMRPLESGLPFLFSVPNEQQHLDRDPFDPVESLRVVQHGALLLLHIVYRSCRRRQAHMGAYPAFCKRMVCLAFGSQDYGGS